MELDAARLGFRLLGATADATRVEDLLAAGRNDGPGHRLTVREREVVALVAQGRTNREIAATLVISEHTVARAPPERLRQARRRVPHGAVFLRLRARLV